MPGASSRSTRSIGESTAGSEWAGILEGHASFRDAVEAAGYEPASSTILLDADVTGVEFRDPKAAILRRQARLEVSDDAVPVDWWEATALGHSQIHRFRLVSKADESELARASAWDMAAFGRADGRARTGIHRLEVAPAHRRKGFGPAPRLRNPPPRQVAVGRGGLGPDRGDQ